jgi:molybdopterin-guanine dinucleotide biosynthesis protein B
LLKAKALRVSVIKQTHHRFDIDHPGKDSWRHRQAGAFEVLVASAKRMALMREYEREQEPDVHALLAQLDADVDWVLVEGFRHCDLPKIEVWRAEVNHPAHYAEDPHIQAIATDDANRLPMETTLTVLSLDAPESVADWLMAQGERLEYAAR